MPCTLADIYRELSEFLDEDAHIVSTFSDTDAPSGLTVHCVEPDAFVAAVLSHVRQAKGHQVLGLCDPNVLTTWDETFLRSVAGEPATVVLTFGAADGHFLARVEGAGGHVQHVQELDDLQTALAAAFISGDTAVVACDIAGAQSSAA